MSRIALPILVIASILVFANPDRAAAQNTADIGLGLIIGDPTGVNGKYMLSEEFAIDAAVGFGVIGGGHLAIHSDFMWQFDLEQWPAGSLDFYLGVGPKLGIGRKKEEFLLGARAPVGVSFLFTGAPLDIFVEVAAGLWIVEKVGFDIDAAIGVRYWF
jgi:hypothetical protein